MPMNSLVCIGVPTTSGGQGARGQGGSKLKLAPLTSKSLLSLPSLPAHWTLLPMSNEQLSMYWGPHHLWGQGARGQGGSKLKVALLTPRSLPSLPSPCCHSPHSQLAGPPFPMSNEQLSMYWGPNHLWGQGTRGQGGSKLKVALLTPRSLPSLPSPCCHSPHSQLAGPPFPMSNEQLSMYWGPNHLWGQGTRGQCGSNVGASGTLLPTLPLLPPHWTLLPMSNEQLSMYWGPHYLWGQGARGQHGSKLKLAPLTPRSLPLLPACSSLLPACSSLLPAPSLLPAHSSSLPMANVCVGVPTTSRV